MKPDCNTEVTVIDTESAVLSTGAGLDVPNSDTPEVVVTTLVSHSQSDGATEVTERANYARALMQCAHPLPVLFFFWLVSESFLG